MLTKAPLENEGGSKSKGSNFEKVVFGPELMTSQINSYSALSKMSLAVAKDSGWYDVDLSTGQQYEWGKDAGCGIFNHQCPKDDVDEACTEINALGCTDNHMYVTVCSKNTFNSQCPIDLYYRSCKIKPTSGNGNNYGPDSVCLNTTVSLNGFSFNSKKSGKNNSDCYQKTCAEDKKSYQIILFNSDGSTKKLDCNSENDTHVISSSLTINCGDPEDICGKMTKCPNDCYYR